MFAGEFRQAAHGGSDQRFTAGQPLKGGPGDGLAAQRRDRAYIAGGHELETVFRPAVKKHFFLYAQPGRGFAQIRVFDVNLFPGDVEFRACPSGKQFRRGFKKTFMAFNRVQAPQQAYFKRGGLPERR